MIIFNRQNILIMSTVAVLNLLVIGCVVFNHKNTEDMSFATSTDTIQKENHDSSMETSENPKKNDSSDMGSFANQDLKVDVESDSTVLNVGGDMSGLYSSIILGRYTVGEKIVFHFHSDGTYSGYFDDNNQDVTEYSYVLEYDGMNYLLNIFNPNKSEKVTYYVTLTEDADIVLKYPKSDVEIKLEY